MMIGLRLEALRQSPEQGNGEDFLFAGGQSRFANGGAVTVVQRDFVGFGVDQQVLDEAAFAG